MKSYANPSMEAQGIKALEPAPAPDISYKVCVLYKLQPKDPEKIGDITSSRDPAAILDLDTTAVHSLLRRHDDPGVGKGVYLRDYHAVYFQDESGAVLFIRRHHQHRSRRMSRCHPKELRFLRRGDTGVLEGLSNHRFHIHAGDRGWEFLKTDKRTPAYVVPCDGNCDDDLSKPAELASPVYKDEDSYTASDEDEVIRFLKEKNRKPRFMFIPGEYPEIGLYLPESLRDKVLDLDIKEKIRFERDNSAGLVTIVSVSEEERRENKIATDRAIERNRRRRRRGKPPSQFY